MIGIRPPHRTGTAGFASAGRRTGLAPLELVLALPLMLFVMALMINFGTVSAWKVRAQGNSRYAAFRSLHLRSGNSDPDPVNWQGTQNSLSSGGGGPVNSVDQYWDSAPDPNDPVIRGPAVADPGGDVIRVVRDLRMHDGAHQGAAIRDGQLPLLQPLLGSRAQYRLDPRQHLLDHRWEFHDLGFPDNRWPRARGGTYPGARGYSFASLVGTSLDGWYALEPLEAGVNASLVTQLEQAYQQLRSYGTSNASNVNDAADTRDASGLDVLDRDNEWRRLQVRRAQSVGGSLSYALADWRDFHPDADPGGVRGIRDVGANGSWMQDLDTIVYGTLLPNGTRANNGFLWRVRLGPHTHGLAYTAYYDSWIRQLQNMISALQLQINNLQMQVPQPAGAAQQIQSWQSQIPPLQAQIDQLTQEKVPYEIFRVEALRLIQMLP